VLIPIKDNRCGHCGNDTTWEMHEPYTLAEEYPHGTEEVSEHKVYSTLFCSTCLQPTLRQTVGRYREIDADWLNISTTVLYPTASTQLSDLPAAIERKYKSALKVRYIEPNACAVLVGRTLEAACNHEKAQGKNLTQKLYFLANDGRIPNTLAEMAQQLKELRNLGAHDAEHEVTNEDVPTIISFLEAILEYLSSLPQKLELYERDSKSLSEMIKTRLF
jgi:Domain of unknown function (DUF4145)